jgi:nitrogen fixation/metabolism regulation signal transduction histidine kinase
VRNYLLDQHFQLKYASYGAGIALIVSLALGILLWRTSEETLAQSQASVELGAEVLAESRKVSDVVAMNIIKDPVYSDNPALKAVFEADGKQQAEKQHQQQEQLRRQAEQLQKQRSQVAIALIGALALLVVVLWLAGIVVTHKIAGPLYKMKRQLRALESGSLEVPSPLRRGDELVSFFEAFNTTVRALRTRQQRDVDRLDSALRALEGVVEPEKLAILRELRRDMQAPLDRNSMAPAAGGGS